MVYTNTISQALLNIQFIYMRLCSSNLYVRGFVDQFQDEQRLRSKLTWASCCFGCKDRAYLATDEP